jgi:hypothetical protein
MSRKYLKLMINFVFLQPKINFTNKYKGMKV